MTHVHSSSLDSIGAGAPDSYSSRSDGLTRNARASRSTTTTVAAVVPRSIEPRYRTLTPARSAKSSWVRPLSARMRRTFAAITRRKSMAGIGNTAGRILPGSILPIRLAAWIARSYQSSEPSMPSGRWNSVPTIRHIPIWLSVSGIARSVISRRSAPGRAFRSWLSARPPDYLFFGKRRTNAGFGAWYATTDGRPRTSLHCGHGSPALSGAA
jgi:hypothetical protein